MFFFFFILNILWNFSLFIIIFLGVYFFIFFFYFSIIYCLVNLRIIQFKMAFITNGVVKIEITFFLNVPQTYVCVYVHFFSFWVFSSIIFRKLNMYMSNSTNLRKYFHEFLFKVVMYLKSFIVWQRRIWKSE